MCAAAPGSPIAQTIHDPASVDPDHAESDRHEFGDMILRLAFNGDEQEAYAILLRLQTKNRLCAKWDAVERVAALLQREKTIDDAALREAVWPGISKLTA